MGIRLQSIFTDDEGLQWTINIHDDTYSSTVIPFTVGGDGFVLQTLIVMPVVLALAFGIALVGDAVLGAAIWVLRRLRRGGGARL